MDELSFPAFVGIVVWILVFPITAGIVASRKNRSSVGWFVLCLFLSPLAILPLLAMDTKDPGPSRRCPRCDSLVPIAAEKCWSCASKLPAPAPSAPADKTCPRCAETVKGAAVVCRYCGHEFGQAIKTAAQ